MSSLDRMYSEYIDSLDCKEKDAKKDYAAHYEQCKTLYNVLYPYREQIENAGVRIGFETEFRMGKLTTFYTEKEISKHSINLFTIDENLIKNYILAYCRAKYRLNGIDFYLRKLKKLRVPFRVYKLIIVKHNTEIAKKLLNGYIFTIGEGVGRIYVKRIKRLFKVGDKDATLNIDWGETKKLRAELLKEGIDIYTKDNPKGKKYLVHYTDDYFYWFWWDKTQCRTANSFLYTFTPTNFINTKSRSQLDFVDNAKSKDDIINTPLLGNRDKLYSLVRFDPSHGLNFITDERERFFNKQSSSNSENS